MTVQGAICGCNKPWFSKPNTKWLENAIAEIDKESAAIIRSAAKRNGINL